MLETQGFEAAQNHMTNRIGEIYGREGVLRRHVELGVRSATGVARVVDPGDHAGFIRGDRLMRTVADELNRNHPDKRPIRYDTLLKPVKSIPLARQNDWMARLQGENISESIITAAQHGQTSDTGGIHPIPGLAHGAHYRAPLAKDEHH